MIERKDLEKLYNTTYDNGKIDGQLYLLKEIIKLYNYGMSINNIIDYKTNELERSKKKLCEQNHIH